MLRVLLLFSLIFFSSFVAPAQEIYDISTPLKGQSIASDSLQKKVLKDVYLLVSKHNSLCTNLKVIDTQLLHFPQNIKIKDGKYVKGNWKELWTVDYCSEKMQIPVTFYINNKDTYYNIDKVN